MLPNYWLVGPKFMRDQYLLPPNTIHVDHYIHRRIKLSYLYQVGDVLYSPIGLGLAGNKDQDLLFGRFNPCRNHIITFHIRHWPEDSRIFKMLLK
jgi:hypothetical protein